MLPEDVADLSGPAGVIDEDDVGSIEDEVPTKRSAELGQGAGHDDSKHQDQRAVRQEGTNKSEAVSMIEDEIVDEYELE